MPALAIAAEDPVLRGSLAQRGFSLVEVIVAMVIAVIAVVGLAHTFAIGRSLIDRYETARSALAYAQGRVELMATLALPNHDPGNAALTPGWHGPTPVTFGDRAASERYFVEWVDDPVDNNPPDANPNDYKRLTMYVMWAQGAAMDTVSLSRTLSAP
jgi:prepilin-type N-terminal cleavage/methylation domain-containing protein